ncbi:hypothetical protein TWF281_003804 [Arthrobotrys megalospora]
MCWNLWTFTQCNHKQAELTQCGRRTLLCRTLNRDEVVTDNVCYNCTNRKNSEITEAKFKRAVTKAEDLYWYVKGIGGAVGMRSGGLLEALGGVLFFYLDLWSRLWKRGGGMCWMV